MKKFKLAFLALAAFSLLAALPTLAATPSAFIMKVEIFNAPDVEPSAPGLRNMVASRVAGEGYTVETGDAPSPNARWNLRTTITKLGGVYSIDAAIESIAPGGDGARTFEKVNSFDDLMGALEKTSERMRIRLEQLATAKPSAQPKAAAAVSGQPVAPVPYAPASAKATDFLTERKELFSAEGETSAMAVVDIDPAPGDEIILLMEGIVVILAPDGPDKMKELFRFEPDLYFPPVSLSAGDTDGDGIVEVFIVGQNDTRVFSQGYTVKDGTFTPRGDPIGAYLRVVKHPDEGDILIGNPTLGGVELFSRNIYRYVWSEDEYVKGDEINVPSSAHNLNSVNINWVRFAPGPGGLWFTMLDDHNSLRIYDTIEIKQAYSAETMIGGTRVGFRGEMRDVRQEEEGDFWEIDPAPAPVVAADGKRYIVIHDNIEESGFMPRRWGSYSSGTLTALNWDGLAISIGAKSAEYEGYFTTYATGKAPDGTQRLFVILITEEGMLMVDQTTHLLAFDF